MLLFHHHPPAPYHPLTPLPTDPLVVVRLGGEVVECIGLGVAVVVHLHQEGVCIEPHRPLLCQVRGLTSHLLPPLLLPLLLIRVQLLLPPRGCREQNTQGRQVLSSQPNNNKSTMTTTTRNHVPQQPPRHVRQINLLALTLTHLTRPLLLSYPLDLLG